MHPLLRAALPGLLAALLASAAPRAAAQERRDPRVAALVAAVEAARLEATVAKLVSFGTRHTLSDAQSPSRGIGAARAFLRDEFAALARAPGSRLEPWIDDFTAPAGPRVPAPVQLVNLGVRLPGTDPARAAEALVVTGHYDSRASDVLDAKSDAPGAVDDGSGTAMVLELARLLAPVRPAITVYLVAVAGEEQGLLGSDHLARRLAAEGVHVVAMASVDIAGNSEGQDGVRDSATARLFSEGVPAAESEADKKLREAVGGENDSPARAFARYLQRVSRSYVEGLEFLSMLRRDRLGRGSDHLSFSRAGVPAVRISETREHYDRQHQDVRSVNGRAFGDDLAHFDPIYAARICRGLLAGLVSLALAPGSPPTLTLGGAVSPETRLRWTAPPGTPPAGYVLYRRRADSVAWQRSTLLGPALETTLEAPPDNEFFAVASTDAAGNESIPRAPTRLE